MVRAFLQIFLNQCLLYIYIYILVHGNTLTSSAFHLWTLICVILGLNPVSQQYARCTEGCPGMPCK